MCNPAETQWHILVGSIARVVFVIQALQACSDRWWKGFPNGPLSVLLLILHVCFVHHDSMHEHDILVEAFRVRNLTPACSLLPESAIILDD